VEKRVIQYFKYWNIRDIRGLILAQNNVEYYIHSKFPFPRSLFNGVLFKEILYFSSFPQSFLFIFLLMLKSFLS